MKIIQNLCFLLAFGILQPAVAQQSDEATGTVDVMGEASLQVEPDYASITIVVEKESKDPAQAQQAVMKEMSEVLSYLKGLKSVSDVQTQVVDLRPRIRDYKSGEKDYYARQMVSFRLTQLNQYDNVILGLLEKGIDGIGQVAFKSSNEKEYEEALMRQAILNAREKATIMSGELGQTIGKAVYISNMQQNSPYPRPDGVRMLKMDSGPSVEPGALTLSLSLNVRFQLK